MAEPTITGSVKWFNNEKGFGFITTERGDVFVHVSQLPAGRTSLEPGASVSCGVRQGRKGLEAVEVRVLSEPGGAPARPAPARPSAGPPRPGPSGARPGPGGARPAPPPASAPRPALVRPAGPHQGASGSITVKMTVIGRPVEVRPLAASAETAPCFALVLETDPNKLPTLPKGLPPASGSTAYLVLIAGRQWRRVAESIASDPEDRLVIEGYGGLDPLAPQMITVRATAVTTTARQRAARASEEAQAAQEEPSQEGASPA
jgi:cold shock CspA family protein